MAKKQDVKEEVNEELKSKELENISGGYIAHVKNKQGEDEWYIIPDELDDLPRPDINFFAAQPFYYGMKRPKTLHGKFSGPYKTKKEALHAAIDSDSIPIDCVRYYRYNDIERLKELYSEK